jgi:T-complex protein 1 subunit delta
MQNQTQQNSTSVYDQKVFQTNEKPKDVRRNNIMSAKSLADVIRTSLGPRGMDKMIRDQRGEVTITNDGATILKKMQVMHPAAKMLVELSKSQDIEAGDGTTSVVVFAGALLNNALGLLEKNIHPTVITDGYQYAHEEAQKVLLEIEKPINLDDREKLIDNAITSLSSKVVSQYSEILAPIAVDAVLKIAKQDDTNIDLRDIKVSRKLGGTIDECEIVEGLIFTNHKASGGSTGGIKRIEGANIGLIQFCLSSPKSEMESTVIVNEYSAMDRIITEERNYIVGLVKKIRAAKCNVLLIQKSILRDAVNEMSLHFLAKAGIMVIKNIERDEIEFISKTLGCTPVAHIDQFTPNKLGKARVCEETTLSEGSKVVRIKGVANPNATVSVLVRGSNGLLLDEAERSLRDALCVVRSIVKRK